MAGGSAARLIQEAERLGVAVDEGRAAALLRYLDLLYLWNARAGLTRVAPEEAWILHILDSLSLVPLLEGSATVVDLGSGAGLPGIPLALLRSDASFTLVESQRRKCSFMNEAAAVLGLSNVTVEQGDAADLPGESWRFEAVVSRAFRSPIDFLKLAEPLMCEQGTAVVMAANPGCGEIAALGSAIPGLRLARELRFELPGAYKRCLLSFERDRD